MKAQLNSCKSCTEEVRGYAKPFVNVNRNVFDVVATVCCLGCGAGVTVKLPIMGNEDESEMTAKFDTIEQIATLAWNTLNV